jgi:hypothetical protein
MKPDIELKTLPNDLLEAESREIFDEVYYNSFAIFAVSLIKEQSELNEEWKNLQAAVAGYIQNNKGIDSFFDDKDIKFDIYLIFLTEFKVDLKLKTEIENNRYYCKKVILEYDKERSIADNLKQLIIFQRIEDKSIKPEEYISEAKFRDNLVKSTNDEKEAIELLEKNIVGLNKEQYDQIINQWLAEVK